MKGLIGMETSGRVREAFRARGHNVWSCDYLPPEDGSPWHYQNSLDHVLSFKCDLDFLIAHPTCTFLTNSGVRWLYIGGKGKIPDAVRWEKMVQAAIYFRSLLALNIKKRVLENPIMHRHALTIIGERPTQIVQPWMFGEYETKATCLWIKGWPKLVPTFRRSDECREHLGIPAGIKPFARVHLASPGHDRWKERSRTYLGIANALATQLG